MKIIDMNEWILSRLTEQERFVVRRGADVFVSHPSYAGDLSSAPDRIFQAVKRVFDLMDFYIDQNFSGGVQSVRVCAPDEEIIVVLLGGYMDSMGIERLPAHFMIGEEGRTYRFRISYVEG